MTWLWFMLCSCWSKANFQGDNFTTQNQPSPSFSDFQATQMLDNSRHHHHHSLPQIFLSSTMQCCNLSSVVLFHSEFWIDSFWAMIILSHMIILSQANSWSETVPQRKLSKLIAVSWRILHKTFSGSYMEGNRLSFLANSILSWHS